MSATVSRTVPGSTLKPENVMTTYHIAQVNIGQIKAPLEDQVMSGFVARLDEINALADSSPGFVWRTTSSTARRSSAERRANFSNQYLPTSPA